MKTQTRFRAYDPDQLLLLPADLRQWLPEDDLAYFLMDLVARLDLRGIERDYDSAQGGQPAYHPRMMTGLLLYAYCVGMPSSRKIEAATYHSVPLRVMAGDQHPDHDTIAEFRRRHLKALGELFVQVLCICRKAGLVKLGHVALDGTKVRANASKHKAMSYGRMEETARRLEEEVRELLQQAERTDVEEDARYGVGRRGDELPEELRFKRSRLKKIQEAMAALEAEAEVRREGIRRREQEQEEERQSERRRGPKPRDPSERPKEKAQRNFTDPDSRIMKDGATKSFEQCYNAQAAVDGASQIIVAAEITQEANDKAQVAPMLEAIEVNTGGEQPKRLSADSGYFSETNVEHLQEQGVDAYVATGRTKHGENPPSAARGRIPESASASERMKRKLRTLKGRATYSKRKAIVEPVFGQIKEVRGFRRFSLRGLEKVRAEWTLICLTHNLLKLFRSGLAPQEA
ncbi:MAG TPA: IS1182 family transposase [Firmicutes bacterium]|nr:IS1182 family transposase [Bacillota bacterium]